MKDYKVRIEVVVSVSGETEDGAWENAEDGIASLIRKVTGCLTTQLISIEEDMDEEVIPAFTSSGDGDDLEADEEVAPVVEWGDK